MAKKRSRPHPPREPSPPPAPATRRPLRADPRWLIYAIADALFTIGYLLAFEYLVTNRFGWAQAILYLLPLCTLIMAVGTAIGRRTGWWLTVAGSAGMLLWTVGLIVVLLTTSAYLSGVYGAFGKAAAASAVLSCAFVVQFAATLPLLQWKWAMTRDGRRAFGLPPLWRAVPA